MSKGKLAVLAIIVASVAAFFIFDLRQYLSIEYFERQRAAIEAYRAAHPVEAVAAFFAIYVVATALSLPGATILTLIAGAVFGLLWGVVIVSFASTLGATGAFLASRYLLRDWVQGPFRRQAEGDQRRRRARRRFLSLRPAAGSRISLLRREPPDGAHADAHVDVHVGEPARHVRGHGRLRLRGHAARAIQDLGGPHRRIRRARDLSARREEGARGVQGAARVRGVEAPARYDNNLVVIGGGSAGLVSAYIAAAVKAKVTLVEKDRMGGDCLNTGCVPSKALIATTKLLARMRRSQELGIHAAHAQVDFREVMERVSRVVREIEPHDSVERYTSLGVDCLKGTAKITSPWTVEVALAGGGTRTLTTRNIVIAAGARPFVPPIPGLREADPLTSENLWELREQPQRLVVLGGGPIGCELAQCFARLGTKVTQVEMLPRLMAREDPEFSRLVEERFRAEGVDVLTGHKAKEVRREGVELLVIVERDGVEHRIVCDRILCAVGRAANVEGYGLEELGVPVTRQKTVEVNEFLQARYPNIYACGDVAGPYQFTHTASHMAWYCAVNALFGRFRKFRVDYSVIPWATFTDPVVARVGINETEAREKKIDHEVHVYRLDDLDRAIADGEAHGLVKVITRRGGKGEILGATIAGEHADDLIAEFVLAMKHRLGMNHILGTIHVYPTLPEANKFAAGVWKRAQVTQGQMAFARAYHAWTRGESGLGAVLGKLGALRDKRPYHDSTTMEA
jgi:pyruvate/2-oxoglutarate dehydrogenase complex dihydrolipoamide dehydrogenase (E3) component